MASLHPPRGPVPDRSKAEFVAQGDEFVAMDAFPFKVVEALGDICVGSERGEIAVEQGSGHVIP